MRGLKLRRRTKKTRQSSVAPLVGAWIETALGGVFSGMFGSHPSWVRGLKLHLILVPVLHLLSHPSWVRGLKHNNNKLVRPGETMSHPSWVRGLKPNHQNEEQRKSLSHPSWVRGLKQGASNNSKRKRQVAPLVVGCSKSINFSTRFLRRNTS